MRKDSVNVKLPMCDTLGFLRLSLVEGFHLAFVQRIWIVCWKFYCMIEDIDELLRTSTGYNFFDVKSATGLKTRWRIFFFFYEQFVQLQHNFENEFPLVSTILQHREGQQGTDLWFNSYTEDVSFSCQLNSWNFKINVDPSYSFNFKIKI